MKEKIIVVFSIPELNQEFDIEIPLGISANELIYGLNRGLNLGIRLNDPSDCYLRSENPVALLRGDTTLEEYKLHQGSKIIYSRG
ncbi:MAG: hypothetical protein K5792_03845 [Butyrivibrio sp.]|nr:hypothetical protein [Butyrivibrio sp.]